MLKIRIKCLSFWSTNAGVLFNDKTLLPGAKAILTCWVCTDLIFETLREYVLDFVMLFVPTRHKTVLETMFLWSSFSE